MALDNDAHSETTPLLAGTTQQSIKPPSARDAPSAVIDSAVSREEKALAASAIGERLPYNDYTVCFLPFHVCEPH